MFNPFNIKEIFDFRFDPIIAVEFGSSSIKVLFLNKTNHQWQVEKYGQTFLPEGICEGTTIKNPEVFAQLLRALLNTLNFKTNKIMLAMPDSMVITKTIQVNEGLTEAEVEQLIILEFGSYVPYPLEEVDFDFEILESSRKRNLRDVLLVATRKDNLQNVLSTFELAGLEVVVVDVLSYAFERALPLLLEAEAEVKDKLILIFDIGFTRTNLYAFSEGEVVFTREEEFGGQQLLELVTAHGGLSKEEKDSWLQGKIPQDLSEQMLVEFNVKLVTQLSRSIEFFFSVSHFNEVHRVYLAGEMAHLPGLTLTAEQKINTPVYLANPFNTMRFAHMVEQHPLLEHSAAWVGVCGLATREKRNSK